MFVNEIKYPLEIKWISSDIQISINNQFLKYEMTKPANCNHFLKMGKNQVDVDSSILRARAIFAVFGVKRIMWSVVAKNLVRNNPLQADYFQNQIM